MDMSQLPLPSPPICLPRGTGVNKGVKNGMPLTTEVYLSVITDSVTSGVPGPMVVSCASTGVETNPQRSANKRLRNSSIFELPSLVAGERFSLPMTL